MRQGKNSATALIIAIMLGGFATTGYADHHGGSHSSLEALATGAHRSAANILRNAERHPVETLEFFGLEANMTVIEILPSTGWYTEIIPPTCAIKESSTRRISRLMRACLTWRQICVTSKPK